MKPSVYVETSVISYLTSKPSPDAVTAARQELTKRWWGEVLPQLTPFISPTVLEEISLGDSNEAKEREEAVSAVGVLSLSPAIIVLAKRIPGTRSDP